jgi:hypothetical protein
MVQGFMKGKKAHLAPYALSRAAKEKAGRLWRRLLYK